jgi:broad specificity phosphatase PhoE
LKIKNIYLIRHGETDWNRDHRFQGKTDIQLNQLGRDQAEKLVPVINRLSVDAVFSSPLLRAHETAMIAVKDLKIPIQKDDRLMEANVGAAEGLTFDELQAKFGENGLDRWRSYEERDLDFAFPQGESKRQMMFRVRSTILEIAQTNQFSNIAVFAHGMVMRSLTFAFQQGVPWDINVFSNGSIHHFVWSEDRSDYLLYKGKIKD